MGYNLLQLIRRGVAMLGEAGGYFSIPPPGPQNPGDPGAPTWTWLSYTARLTQTWKSTLLFCPSLKCLLCFPCILFSQGNENISSALSKAGVGLKQMKQTWKIAGAWPRNSLSKRIFWNGSINRWTLRYISCPNAEKSTGMARNSTCYSSYYVFGKKQLELSEPQKTFPE